jgi:uncharacterized protein (TIGR00730 family)
MGADGIYRETAAELGRTLAREKVELVFGGGKVGLMGVMADAALEAGGKVTGVIPAFMHIPELAHDGITSLITVNSMHERKELIHRMCDAFIALPGGFGTLDEWFETLTWGQLGLHQKPVGLLNINDYFKHILKAIDAMVEEQFLKGIHRDMLLVSGEIGELLVLMHNYRAPAVPKWIR